MRKHTTNLAPKAKQEHRDSAEPRMKQSDIEVQQEEAGEQLVVRKGRQSSCQIMTVEETGMVCTKDNVEIHNGD